MLIAVVCCVINTVLTGSGWSDSGYYSDPEIKKLEDLKGLSDLSLRVEEIVKAIEIWSSPKKLPFHFLAPVIVLDLRELQHNQ